MSFIVLTFMQHQEEARHNVSFESLKVFTEYLAFSKRVLQWYRSAQISIAYLELGYLGQSEHGRSVRILKDGC